MRRLRRDSEQYPASAGPWLDVYFENSRAAARFAEGVRKVFGYRASVASANPRKVTTNLERWNFSELMQRQKTRSVNAPLRVEHRQQGDPHRRRRRDPGERSASEWAGEMARLRTEQPRPLHKRYGPNPTHSQIEIHKSEEREWNRRYRHASKMQKKQLVLDNEEYRRRQTSGDPRRSRLTRAQQEYVHKKIRILRREHPEWKQNQVVAVAYSYARKRGR